MHDVIVAGAGLAGLHTARLLALRGAKVLLVDRKQRLDGFVHTTGIFVRQTLETFGLPDDVLGAPVRNVSIHSRRGHQFEVESAHDEFRVGDMRALYRFLLQQCERAGVEFICGTSYRGSEPDRHWSLVSLESRTRRWCQRARFIVGADGARSRVAADLALDVNTKFITALEEVHRSPSEETRLHVVIDPLLAPGYIGWVTEADGEMHVGVGGSRSFDVKRSMQQMRAIAARLVERELARPDERRGGLIPAGGVGARIASRRGLLVGDAAGAVSPLTAGGLDGSLRLSQFAAGLISDALESHDNARLLRYRGDLLRTRFVSRLWMRAALERFRSPLLVEAGVRLLATPLLQPLVRHVFFGRGSFPDPAAILTAAEA